jgi:hypothetical protein
MLAARIKYPDAIEGLGEDASKPQQKGSTSAEILNAIANLSKAGSESWATITGQSTAAKLAAIAAEKRARDAAKGQAQPKKDYTMYFLIGGGVLLLGILAVVMFSGGKKK